MSDLIVSILIGLAQAALLEEELSVTTVRAVVTDVIVEASLGPAGFYYSIISLAVAIYRKSRR